MPWFINIIIYKRSTQHLKNVYYWDLSQLAIWFVNILRREVWTVKVTKICRTHFNYYINIILSIYVEASVRRF